MKKWSTTLDGKAEGTRWLKAGKASRPNNRLEARTSTCRIGTRRPAGRRRSIRILLQDVQAPRGYRSALRPLSLILLFCPETDVRQGTNFTFRTPAYCFQWPDCPLRP